MRQLFMDELLSIPNAEIERLAYFLPGGMNWVQMAAQRKGVDPAHAPLAHVEGIAVAWGRLLASDYTFIKED